MKNKVVQYIKEYTIEEGVIIPVEAYKSIVVNHTKRYHNCLYLLANLGTCARNLMDYLVESMTGDNIVYSNKHVRETFRNIVTSVTDGRLEYSDSSIKKAFGELAAKALIRYKERGVYLVNPAYFMKNGDTERLEMIKVELEFHADLDTQLKIIKGNYKEEIKETQPYLKDEIN